MNAFLNPLPNRNRVPRGQASINLRFKGFCTALKLANKNRQSPQDPNVNAEIKRINRTIRIQKE